MWARQTSAYPIKNIPGHPIGKMGSYEDRVMRHVMDRR
jgi:hypothetical protein